MNDPNEVYRVTQECGTEAPFANKYWNNHEAGLYLDIVSGELLFFSDDKFDSGTGWPSFTQPTDKNAIVERRDTSIGLERVEIRGAKSDSHLGHVFNDGPAPGGMRYCVNSAALRFVPRNESTAVFAGGCFWGLEAYFRRVAGVLNVRAGYCGGKTEPAGYEAVCAGETGHAESVEILFDPARISYHDLLRHFFRVHDPSTRDRQGNDVGSQYRSAIFYLSEGQRLEALSLIAELTKAAERISGPIVTEVAKFERFYPAEEYHQRYLEKHPGGYCHVNLSLAGRPLE